MGILKLITYVAAAITLALSGYLAKLLNDTNLMEQVTAIPSDNINYFHIAALAVIAWLLLSWILKVASKMLLIVLLLLAVVTEGTFITMNINGSIVEQVDVLEDAKDAAEDMLDELKDAIGN